MNCAAAKKALLRLDYGEGPDPSLRSHLDACPACRGEAELLDRAFAFVREQVDPPTDLVENVMAQIDSVDFPEQSVLVEPSTPAWGAVGLVLVLSLAFAPRGADTAAFNLALGVLIAVCALFGTGSYFEILYRRRRIP